MSTNLCGCELLQVLHERDGRAVYRGRRIDDDVPVVVKVVRAGPGAADAAMSLRHEHAILDGLSGTSVPRVHGLVHEREHWGLLLEDTGGRSLADLGLAGTLSVEEFLDLAIRIAEILEDIHRQQVVHKDINPSNLIWNPHTGRLVLIDFGIATVLSQETTELVGVGGLKGTLAYMSPEQTGRMNQVVDYRTDHYSLGVTFYELLTGRLPFDARDPLQLVHCHIARRPPSLRELDPGIPQALADMVHKLMAKDALRRYQSASGLRADLVRCRRELGKPGPMSAFPLGQKDRSERFRLPQKLYGRDREIDRLVAAFERASAGAATLVLVSGYVGIGKSALIRELYRPITALRGYFIAGKLDQYQNNEPYAPLVQALRALVAQILTEERAHIEAWRDGLLAALQGNVQVLVEVCPELGLITGSGPASATLPAEARDRFQQAVCALVTVAATTEHPLCLVVDDLQWADADTLALLEELMVAAGAASLLIIGTCRANEVSATHPLALTVARIEEQCGPITHLELLPLPQEAVTALVADTLSMAAADVAPLAELLAARTGGNPFFLRSFLVALHEDGLLQFTAEGWQWDLARIRQRGVTDNVVELMVARIQRLPRATQEVLRVAACLGSDFDLGTLIMVTDRPHEELARDLFAALAAELVLVLEPVCSAVDMAARAPELRCRFAHDRIQQAVVSTMAEGALATLHLAVGRRLIDRLDPEARAIRLFDIVGHLDQGRAALGASPDAGELERFARLHLGAARKALEAAAAQPAHQYARAGIALLDGGWDTQFELMRDLHIKAAEAAFLGGDLESLEALAAIVLARAHDVRHQAIVWKLQGQAYLAQGDLKRALQTYKDALACIGFPLPEQVSQDMCTEEMRAVAAGLGDRAIEDLLDLAECTDPTTRLAMEFLDHMMAMAQPLASELMPIVVCRLVRLSQAHGHTPHSAFGYLFYATQLSQGGDIDRAYRHGRLAVKLADRFGDKSLICQIYQYAQVFVLHWKEPLYELLPALVHAYRQGTESGNRFYAATSALNLCIARFLAGDELGGLIADMKRYSDRMHQLRQPMLVKAHQIFERAAIRLHQGRDDSASARADDEARRVQHYREANDAAMLHAHHYCKAFVCYMLGAFDEAAAAIEAGEEYQHTAIGIFWAAPVTLLDSLCRLAVHERADDQTRARIVTRVAANQARLAAWLPHCPASFEHKLRLVEAELERVLGRRDQAAAAFESAVAAARRSGYGHEAALACELAARFYLEAGQPERARELLREAHRGYLRWGAIAKVRDLEKCYPGLLPRMATSALDISTRATISTREWDIDVLDVIGVLDASQAISREIERDRLLTRLMELVIEIAGAQAGYLLLDHDGIWRVEVEKTADREAATILGSIPMDQLEARGHRGVPTAIVRYVARTQDSVVLDDATADPQFGRDPCVVRHQIKSALCSPLTRQGGQRGVLYLENNLVTGAFTPTRIQVLHLLSTQAVISLENALLYDTLEQKVADRTHELAGKNQELAATLARLRETQDRLIVQERLASLGALSAGVAHELRNPLNFVSNFAKLSEKHLATLGADLSALPGSLGPDQTRRIDSAVRNLERNLAKIVEHSQRIDGIIRAMLDHSRGGSGQRVSTNLNALIHEYIKLARHGLHARAGALDIVIETELDASLGPVMATPQELGRVLINLLDNACHALMAKHAQTPAGFEPRIQVRTLDLGDRAQICVHDNGTGIPWAVRSRILDAFFTTKHAGEGTGLGLSISHEIITKGYGGTLTFDSQEGLFTEFVVTIPKL
jgi:histidine kinase